MSMVCPQCHSTYEQRTQCPTCDVRLHHSLPRPVQGTSADAPGRWQQTPWGRIIVGVIFAEGLYFGLRQLFTAGILAIVETNSSETWGTLLGLILSQVLQGVCLVLGGILAGAGQRRGFIMGAMVGAWTGIIFVVMHQIGRTELTPVALYGLPALQMAFGAWGGFIGTAIWRPMPTFDLAQKNAQGIEPTKPKRLSPLSGPIAWGRVFVGVTLAATGALSADYLLQFVLESSKGSLNIQSHMQAKLVTWEITGLAMLAGSALAGATTINSMKQGLMVGVGTTIALLCIRLSSNTLPVQPALLTLLAALGLGIVGGWFGGQLFPPIYRRAKNSFGPLTI